MENLCPYIENSPPTYPQVIEHTSASIVIALCDTEIGKIQLTNTLVFVDVHIFAPQNLIYHVHFRQL